MIPTEEFRDKVCDFLSMDESMFDYRLEELRSQKQTDLWKRWGGGTVEETVAELLYILADYSQPKLILEAGTNWGYSVSHLILGIKTQNCKIYTIESSEQNYEKGKEELEKRKLYNKVNHILGDSAKEFERIAKDKVVDFCFIDSSHTYDHTKKEFNAIKESLRKESLVCFHDAVAPRYGVKKFIDELSDDTYLKLILPTQPNTGFAIVKLR